MNPPTSLRTSGALKARTYMDIPAALVAEIVSYDPASGIFTWVARQSHGDARVVAWNARHAGKEAFTFVSKGYRRGKMLGVSVSAHRVAFALMNAEWPTGCVDHINGDKQDNRWENLRLVSVADNNKNKKYHKKNKAGCLGVYSHKGKFKASISIRGRNVSCGTFADVKSASAARSLAFEKLGYHENHGYSK